MKFIRYCDEYIAIDKIIRFEEFSFEGIPYVSLYLSDGTKREFEGYATEFIKKSDILVVCDLGGPDARR